MTRPSQNIKLTIEYQGTQYYGWQRQKDQPSVQEEIETAIFKATNEKVNLFVAGRTDAGVHARAQVANFSTTSQIGAWQICRALNYYLPDDITIHQSDAVPEDFNARHDSLAKRYWYNIYRGPQPAALERKRSWWILENIDLDLMQEAANKLVGEHDLNAFRSVHCDAKHAIRHIKSIQVETASRIPLGEIVTIKLYANAFCRHMCRIISGTLVEIGLGKREVSSMDLALKNRKREFAGSTAPAYGLTLMEVEYPHQP
ncbi:MAG: tRNA pseudouridine(38-40) synthase TruA [Myxococcota bacterium]|nr:tRNA pseudouridine(38-40) synthase TruA [Myxococcota bacterium]